MTADEMYTKLSENTYIRLGVVVGLVVFAFWVGSDQTEKTKALEQTQQDVQDIKELLLSLTGEYLPREQAEHWIKEFRKQNEQLSVPSLPGMED